MGLNRILIIMKNQDRWCQWRANLKKSRKKNYNLLEHLKRKNQQLPKYRLEIDLKKRQLLEREAQILKFDLIPNLKKTGMSMPKNPCLLSIKQPPKLIPPNPNFSKLKLKFLNP
jgi:hypothetical protein